MQYVVSILLLVFLEISYANAKTEEQAPDFNLLNSYGETVKLSEFKGQTVVLEWTNHGCPFVAKHYKTNKHFWMNWTSLEPFFTKNIYS